MIKNDKKKKIVKNNWIKNLCPSTVAVVKKDNILYSSYSFGYNTVLINIKPLKYFFATPR